MLPEGVFTVFSKSPFYFSHNALGQWFQTPTRELGMLFLQGKAKAATQSRRAPQVSQSCKKCYCDPLPGYDCKTRRGLRPYFYRIVWLQEPCVGVPRVPSPSRGNRCERWVKISPFDQGSSVIQAIALLPSFSPYPLQKYWTVLSRVVGCDLPLWEALP